MCALLTKRVAVLQTKEGKCFRVPITISPTPPSVNEL